MTEGLALVLGFAFGRLRLHRVEAACLPTQSRQPVGAVDDRLPRGRPRPEYLCIDGKWQDHVLFGLLRDEWLARQE